MMCGLLGSSHLAFVPILTRFFFFSLFFSRLYICILLLSLISSATLLQKRYRIQCDRRLGPKTYQARNNSSFPLPPTPPRQPNHPPRTGPHTHTHTRTHFLRLPSIHANSPGFLHSLAHSQNKRERQQKGKFGSVHTDDFSPGQSRHPDTPHTLTLPGHSGPLQAAVPV